MKVEFKPIENFDDRNPLGFIVLQTDFTLERDIATILSKENIDFHIARIPSALEVTS